MSIRRNPILAHHLVLSAYGFWLANDPRGSGSRELRQRKFEELGPVHRGRKWLQPDLEALRAFYARAFPKLEHRAVWFDEEMRRRVGGAFAEVVKRCGYTVWACSIGSNHAHLCVRRHRDDYVGMWGNLTAQVRTTLVAEGVVGTMHPVWAERAYSVYLYSREDILRVVRYVEGNPGKEGLPRQRWGFVRAYDGWPGGG